MDPITIEVGGERPYEVRVGVGTLGEDAASVISGTERTCAVITDEHVAPLYRKRLPERPTFTMAAGETSKSFAHLERLLDFLAESALDRSSFLVALGGGVVCDVAGLAAALYMRGIDWVAFPTTLLAQVDASVGGKTAVNLEAGKNLAGAFHAPSRVVADCAALASLPEEEYRSGLGEVLKTGLVDGELFTALQVGTAGLVARDPEELALVVAACVRTKARIVGEDERESGARRALNLGHTFAHGIERAAGYGRIPHGIAVACGTGIAIEASAKISLLEDAQLPEKYRRLTSALGLPHTLDRLRETFDLPLGSAAIREGMRRDKKGDGKFVLLKRAGELVLDVELDDALVQKLLA